MSIDSHIDQPTLAMVHMADALTSAMAHTALGAEVPSDVWHRPGRPVPAIKRISKRQADLLWQLHDGQPRMITRLVTNLSGVYQAVRALARWNFVRIGSAPHPDLRQPALWAEITMHGRNWLYTCPTAPRPSEAVKRYARRIRRQGREARGVAS